MSTEYENTVFELDTKQIGELLELCGFTKARNLSNVLGVSYCRAQEILSTVKKGQKLKVTGSTLDKLCDLLTAYPEELIKDKDG